jgi:hypothetical protein
LAASFAGLSVIDDTGAAFITLLGVGGFVFGLLSTSIISYLTGVVPATLASDLSGLLSTLVPLSAAVGVATFGGIYLAVAAGGGTHAAIHAFMLVCALFAGSALLAAIASVMALAPVRS